MAGNERADASWIIDPEPLLLATTTFGRYEPRLFDEVLDWLNTNGQAVNLQRLQNLGQHLGQRSVLNGLAAHLAKRTANFKWRALLRETKAVSHTELLFPDIPVVGEPDELFARYGWRRGPVRLRQLSQAPDPRYAANLLFTLRALFGVQASPKSWLICSPLSPGILAKWPGDWLISRDHPNHAQRHGAIRPCFNPARWP